MAEIIVFLGPSLPLDRARAALDATFRPPAQQGDVLRALAARPAAIGIVDGYFNVVPSVWHKEILAALSAGVHVFGASSMGALRAAELHAFGMAGVGRVFEWYRDGVLEDDDEVAVTHGPADEGYRELSAALVNVRDLLEAARGEGAIGPATAEGLAALAKRMFYPERTYPALLEAAREAGLPRPELDAFEAFRKAYGPSLKARDALAMLSAIGELIASNPGPHRPHFELEPTVFFEALRNDVELSRATGLPATPSDPDEPLCPGLTLRAARQGALLAHLAALEAERLGVAPSPHEVQAAADAFRRERGLASRDAMLAWLRREGLSAGAFTDSLREKVLVEKLERVYAHEMARRVPFQARLCAPSPPGPAPEGGKG